MAEWVGAEGFCILAQWRLECECGEMGPLRRRTEEQEEQGGVGGRASAASGGEMFSFGYSNYHGSDSGKHLGNLTKHRWEE